jgi:hypothetical protein
MNIQDRIRQLQANVVRPGVNSAGVRPPAQQAAPETPEQRSDRLSGEAAAMSEEQFTDAFKRQVQARDARLTAKAADSNAMIERIRAARQTGTGDAPQVSALAQQMMYRPDGSVRPVPSNAMLDKWSDIDAQAGRKRQDGGHIAVPPSPPRRASVAAAPAKPAAAEAEEGPLPPVPSRDTNAERIEQLTESGMTPAEAARIAGFERSVHGAVSPQLSDANNTPEAKAERARRVEGLRRTEARQDDYARSQLGGHLTGREAFEARAQQEGLRGTPAAKPQGWQPISQQDFTDRAAGYGLSPEEAARAYSERPKATPANPGLGMSNAQQAQEARREAEWLKTAPGIHRKHATNDQAKYGDGTPADQITPEQYEARIERRNQERAAIDPEFAAHRQIEKLAKASGKTPAQVEADMRPRGPSEAYLERQAARKAQHARANEAIWERKGYTGHLDEKTRSADPATVREGLSRLGQITGNPMYRERLAAMDAEDAAKGEHTRGMERLTAEQKHALGMQDDLQAGDLEMEGARQKGAKDARDDQAVENEKDRTWKSGEAAAEGGRALSVIELNQKNELERMEKAGTISNESAEKLAELRQKEATHAAGIAEERAAADARRQQDQTVTEGDQAVRVKQAERAAAGTPQSTANGYADEAFANPALSMGNSRNEMAAQLRSNHPHLSEDQALELATSTLRRRALMNAAGGSMHPGVRSHLTNEMKRLGDDGRPTVDPATNKPSAPMTQEEFRAYANTHAGMSPEQADAVYNDLNGVTPSAGRAELPPVPAGRVGPPRPAGQRRSGGAWSQPTPEEVEKARADRKKAAEDASKGRRKHPYSKE